MTALVIHSLRRNLLLRMVGLLEVWQTQVLSRCAQDSVSSKFDARGLQRWLQGVCFKQQRILMVKGAQAGWYGCFMALIMVGSDGGGGGVVLW